MSSGSSSLARASPTSDGLLHDLVVPSVERNYSYEEDEEAINPANNNGSNHNNNGAVPLGNSVQSRMAAYLAATSSPSSSNHEPRSSNTNNRFKASTPRNHGGGGEGTPETAPLSSRSSTDARPTPLSSSARSTWTGQVSEDYNDEDAVKFQARPGTAIPYSSLDDDPARTKGLQANIGSSLASDDSGSLAPPPPLPSRVESALQAVEVAAAASSQDSVSTATPLPVDSLRRSAAGWTSHARPGAMAITGRPPSHPEQSPVGLNNNTTNNGTGVRAPAWRDDMMRNHTQSEHVPAGNQHRHRRSQSYDSATLYASVPGRQNRERTSSRDSMPEVPRSDGRLYPQAAQAPEPPLSGYNYLEEVAGEDEEDFEEMPNALVVAAELSPPDLNQGGPAPFNEREVEERVRQKIFQEAAQAHVVRVDRPAAPDRRPGVQAVSDSRSNDTTSSNGSRRNVMEAVMDEEAQRIAEFKRLHKHKSIKEKVFGNARSASTKSRDMAAQPECIRKRSTLPWTVKRNPATNLWVTSVQTNQKAVDAKDASEMERSIAKFPALTQQDALEMGQALAKPRMMPYEDNPICFVCRDKFALLRRPSHCRNCGVCICNLCVVHWPHRMIPETFNVKQEGNVKVCLACDWLATSFREALLEGNYTAALDLYATGNVNIRTPFCNVKKYEILYPIHAAVVGGNLRLVQWLTNTKRVPLTHFSRKGKEGRLTTSKGRSPLQIALEANHMEIICHLVGDRGMSFGDEKEFKDATTLVTFAESLVRLLPNNFFHNQKQGRIEGTMLPAEQQQGASLPRHSSHTHGSRMMVPFTPRPSIPEHGEDEDEDAVTPPSPIISQGDPFPCDMSSLGPSASQADRRCSF